MRSEKKKRDRIMVIVFNATFNNISTIAVSFLLVVETGVLGENHRPAVSHIILYRVYLALEGFELTNLVVIDTDCIHVGSCKSNYNTITTTTVPKRR
jgi:hypothetical protein